MDLLILAVLFLGILGLALFLDRRDGRRQDAGASFNQDNKEYPAEHD
jgi:hypothetical protein